LLASLGHRFDAHRIQNSRILGLLFDRRALIVAAAAAIVFFLRKRKKLSKKQETLVTGF
jgi:hypothetical protein